MKLLQHKYFVPVAVTLAVLVRAVIAINGGRSLFFSGPDAPTYEMGALDFVEKGFLSPDIEGLPGWASGYTIFLYPFRFLFGESWWILVSSFQILLFVFSSLFLYQSIKQFPLSRSFLSISFLYVLFSPTHIYFTSEIMYESLTASFAMLCFGGYLLQIKETKYSQPVFLSSLSLLIFIQPKFILVLIPWFIGACRRFGLMNSAYRLVLVVSIPIVIIVRNYISYGLLTFSTNFSIATQYGLGESGLWEKFMPDTDVSESEFLFLLLKFFIQNPIEATLHFVKQLMQLVGPVNGGGDVPAASTWIHGLDPTRIFAIVFSDSFTTQIFLFQSVLHILLFVFFVISASSIFRKQPDFRFVLYLILAVFLTHAISNGESRYFLPVYWAYHPLALHGAFLLVQQCSMKFKSANLP